MDLVKDENTLWELHSLLDELEKDVRQDMVVNHIHKKIHTGRETWLNARLGNDGMDFFILYLCEYVNNLPKYTWESMGKSNFVCSLVQLIFVNQHKVTPFDRMVGALVGVEGLCTFTEFEVI